MLFSPLLHSQRASQDTFHCVLHLTNKESWIFNGSSAPSSVGVNYFLQKIILIICTSFLLIEEEELEDKKVQVDLN